MEGITARVWAFSGKKKGSDSGTLLDFASKTVAILLSPVGQLHLSPSREAPWKEAQGEAKPTCHECAPALAAYCHAKPMEKCP